ncbi:MAG: hypothetical protein ABFQ95_05185 [Pseudomonadota bacterium]
MKKIAITFILGAMLANPAISMVGAKKNSSKDIIVTINEIKIDSKGQENGTAIITINNPSIYYKVQHGKAKSESLTANRFVSLWSTESDISDSFADNPPNAKLTFWDQDKGDYYESEFMIEEAHTNKENLQIKIKFLQPNQPVVLTYVASNNQSGKTIIPIAQFKQLVSGAKTSAVLTIDNSPLDPRS